MPRRRPIVAQHAWEDIAPVIAGLPDYKVAKILDVTRALNVRIIFPNGLKATLHRSGDDKRPYGLCITKAMTDPQSALAPALSHVTYTGDCEWMVGDVEKGHLAQTLAELATIKMHAAQVATQRLHNVLGPPVGGYLF